VKENGWARRGIRPPGNTTEGLGRLPGD